MNMPFGKHKGKSLGTVPKGYLRWLLKQGLREPLSSAVRRALLGIPEPEPIDYNAMVDKIIKPFDENDTSR